jgi:hypothetical protein
MNKSNCLVFFCDIANYASAKDYEKAIENEMSNSKIDKQLTDQIWVNSKIATKKYYLVTVSIIIFVALVVSSVLFILVASWR